MNTWIVTLINLMLNSISGPLRQQIVQSVLDWEKKAAETKDNPWDDVMVAIVKSILNIK